MLPPLPRCSSWVYSSLISPSRVSLPRKGSPGRPAHRPFRGLLGVHSLRPAHSRGHQFVTRYPKASDISSPPCLLRLLPAGANRRVGLAPTGKRRLATAHPHSRPPARQGIGSGRPIGTSSAGAGSGACTDGTSGRGATRHQHPRPRSPRRHWASGTIAHSARRVPLCALDVVEDREATRDDPGEALAVGRSLPGLAHRDEWYVLPHLHLQFRRNATLLGKIAGIEPGATQFLDARAVGPAVVGGLAVGPQIRIAERVDVRDRAIDQREENVPSALVRRRLACPPLDDGAEFHLLQIDIETGTAQLIAAD